MRTACGVTLLLALLASGAAPPGPTRYLTAAEEKAVAALEALLGDHASAGRFEKAVELARAIAEYRKERQGARHWQAGDARRKVESWEQLSKVAEKDRGVVALGWQRNREAAGLFYRGKAGEAMKLMQEALDIRTLVLGEQHPHTAESYNNLAGCLQAQGKAAEALPLLRKAVQIQEKGLGLEHPDTAQSYNNLAGYLHAQGKAAEALPLLRKALLIREKVLGLEHPNTATSYSNLAECLQAQGKAAEALPLLRKALLIREKVLGLEHPDTAQSYDKLAGCLQAQGKAAEALPLRRKALLIREKVLGLEHPQTALSYNNLAVCLNAQEKAAEALPLHLKAVLINERVLGLEHPQTALSYGNLAVCLRAQGKTAEALPLLRKAVQIQEKVLGLEHPGTATSYANLARCLGAQGKAEEALRVLQANLRGYEVSRVEAARSGFDRARATQRYHSPHAVLACGLALAGQPRNAFRHAELALGRSLLDDLATLEPATRQRLDDLARQLDGLEARLIPLLTMESPSADQRGERTGLLAQVRRLAAERSALAASLSTEQVLPLSAIQAQMPADAALVFWLDAWDMHLGCVLRSEGLPHWVNLRGSAPWTASDDSLPQRVDLALQGRSLSVGERDALLAGQTKLDRNAILEALDPRRQASLLAALRKQRLDPLEPHLKGVCHLLVVPAGAMSRVPVEAISDSRTVSYLTSGTFLARQRQRHRPLALSSALVLADPAYQRPVTPLPSAPGYGLLVQAVGSDGVGAKVGLRRGDVLLEYAGKKLVRAGDLAEDGKASTPVTLWREGKTLRGQVPAGKLGVRVDDRPISDALAAWRDEQHNEQRALRGGDWADLPGTRVEAQMLKAMLPSSTLLLRSEASQAKLAQLAAEKKLKGFRLLHIASHGESNASRPELSALVLAQDRLAPEDLLGGRLTVQDVLDTWELDADLVVLSACQTGLGQQTRGDGMLGFAQALLQRGARSVVLSRWKVDDSATSLLMARFYQNLLGKREGLKAPLGRAAALAEAKRWLRELPLEEAREQLAMLSRDVARGKGEKALLVVPRSPKDRKDRCPYANPQYWAAFVLLGDPE